MEDLTLDNEAAEDVQSVFTKAAWAAKSRGWDIEVDDLIQELWIWYLEYPGIQGRLNQKLATTQANKIAASEIRKEMIFNVTYDYSIETVKDILKGKIRGRKSVEDLADAIESLKAKNEDYTNVIAKRYYTNTKLTDSEQQTLKYAHVRLTDEINRVTVRDEYAPVPGKTLGDGLGRPKPQSPPLGVSDYEELPAPGYYERRA